MTTGRERKVVLFDACMLAKELDKLKTELKGKVTNKVWVELLSYAGSHSRANSHIQQLSKGGELLTFVWLLMAQLGGFGSSPFPFEMESVQFTDSKGIIEP